MPFTYRMDFVEGYLRRLGVARIDRPDAAALTVLHEAHLERIPFENLDVAFGADASLDPAALAEKMLDRGRGGFCYELNGLFARLLTELGYDVVLLAAGVGSGPPLDHLALRVTCADGARLLADVGFGAHSRRPLRWEFGVDQDDPDGTFRLDERGADVAVSAGSEVEYTLELHPRELSDFTAMAWYQQHSPASHFTTGTVCTRTTPDGRVTIHETTLTVTGNGEKHETVLADDAAVLAAYREHFGMSFDRVPRLR